MTDRMENVLAAGRVAVITGAAKGIGEALARALASRGMQLALFDSDREALERLAQSLGTNPLLVVGDVTNTTDLRRLRDATVERFGDIALLVNNAGISAGAGPWGDPEAWKRQLDVNFGGILSAQHLFVPLLVASDRPSAIVNLGSKEGITTPPGNAAYSVAKAAVKVLTEQLSHELLKETKGRVSAHLLVPGYTWTPMNAAHKPDGSAKPDEAWTAAELVAYFLDHLFNDDFYIICPDNTVTSAMDAKRIQWSANDVIENRPALSRWHPNWKDRFAEWMRG
ncbi:SDR family oxidoreductase [Rhizobium sp. CNPSo 3490]|uniref:SDR family oxidoreductase n=1 Tax=Rhizobium sp. CNPSo 3490 TaxID=3021407 RepID=UPI00254A4B73|nr:SDR family oxidoreductase [Rhizobium sp. CNPSo 3490]MDK4731465.1 SDR family NAD(P)-dependent oxidoreductase [Rhizobium sp. CNPSo 3490]